LDFLLPNIDIEGPAIIVVSEIVQTLESYGCIAYSGNHALGIFLSTVKTFVGNEIQDFIDELLLKYELITPAIKPPDILNWKSKETGTEILEAVVGENTLKPISFFQKGLDASRSVALILVNGENKSWSGTGFLIGSNVLITNNHVIPSRDISEKAIFRFNYEVDFNGNPKDVADYKHKANGEFFTNSELDVSIVELDSEPGNDWGILKLSQSTIEQEQRVNIIQHPGGMPKSASFRNNFVKYVNAKVVQYVTTTMPGSSGSPVFSDSWEVVGLHHAGGYLVEPATGINYFRNEGILIKAIMKVIPDEFRNLILYSAG